MEDSGQSQLVKNIISLCELDYDDDAYGLIHQSKYEIMDPYILICAAGNILEKTFREYVRKYPDHINYQDNDGRTALIYCAMNDYGEGVELLLKNKADPSLVDDKGQTAFMIACKEDNISIIETLSEYDACVDVKDITNSYALHYICRDGLDTILDDIVNEKIKYNIKTKISAKNIINKTPFDYGIEYLLQETGGIFEDSFIALLETYDDEIDFDIDWGNLCIRCLVNQKYQFLEYILNDHLTDIDDEYISRMINILLSKVQDGIMFNFNEKDIEIHSKIDVTILEHIDKFLNKLFDKTVEIFKRNHYDYYDNNLMHYACILNKSETIIKLLEDDDYKIDLDYYNTHGYTPLMYSIIKRCDMTTEILKHDMVDINCYNPDTKESVFTLALKSKNHEIITMIVNHDDFNSSVIEKSHLIKLLKLGMTPALGKLLLKIPANYVTENGNTLLLRTISKGEYNLAIIIIKLNEKPMITHINNKGDDVLSLLSMNANSESKNKITKIVKEIFKRLEKDKLEILINDETIIEFMMKNYVDVVTILLYQISNEKRQQILTNISENIPDDIMRIFVKFYPESFTIKNISPLLESAILYGLYDDDSVKKDNVKNILLKLIKKESVGNTILDNIIMAKIDVWGDLIENKTYHELSQDNAQIMLKYFCLVEDLDKNHVKYFADVLEKCDINMRCDPGNMDTIKHIKKKSSDNPLLMSLINILKVDSNQLKRIMDRIELLDYKGNLKPILSSIPVGEEYNDFTIMVISKIKDYSRESLKEYLFFRKSSEITTYCISNKKINIDMSLVSSLKKYKMRLALAFIHFNGYLELSEKYVDYVVKSKKVQKMIKNMYHDNNVIKKVWESGYIQIVKEMINLKHVEDTNMYEQFNIEMNKLMKSDEEEVNMPDYLDNLFKENNKKVKDVEDKKGIQCPNCFEVHNKVISFEPCNHFGMCQECAESHNVCPVCNKRIFTKIIMTMI